MSENRAVNGIPNHPIEKPNQGKNYLFAVGINKYRDEKIPKLSNACRDIIDLASLLKEDYNFDDQTLLLDDQATRSNIINKLNELPQKISPDDKLLIYYSGHGKVDENDDTRGYWIPVDGVLSDKSSFVTNADVTDIIKSIDARHILLISDSCFSAALLQKFRSLDEEGAYDQMEKSKSRWAFVSGKGVVSDGDEGENSPFAKGIIKQLTKNRDKINISLLADQVMKQVSNVYDQEAIAIPLRTKEHEEGGQFVFVKKQTEKEIWALAIAQNDEGNYLDYLYKYPDGMYKVEAEKKLKDIADENEWHRANEKNAAFAYRHYLKIYPDGIHVIEANNRLQEIRSEDIRENEKEIVGSQRKNIETLNEKKDMGTEKPRPKPQPVVINTNQPSFFKKNIFLISLFGLIIISGSVLWFLKTGKGAANTGVLPDQTTSNLDSITESERSFEITGVVIDRVNQNPLSGIVLTNRRTQDSATTDARGHFEIGNTLTSDTIVIAKNANYIGRILIAGQIKDSGLIRLQENKTITVIVSGNTRIKARVYVERNGKIIAPYQPIKTNGKLEIKDVSAGDTLWLDLGNEKFPKKITHENIYNYNADTDILGTLLDNKNMNINLSSDSSFEVTGTLKGGANKNKLSGIVLGNKRTKERTVTDDLGQFRLGKTKKGDTILMGDNADYIGHILIVRENKDLGDIELQAKKGNNGYKNISGTVTGDIIWMTFVERNGKKIGGSKEVNGTGTYQIEDVKEGDILLLITTKGKYNKKVGKENNYDFKGDSIIAY